MGVLEMCIFICTTCVVLYVEILILYVLISTATLKKKVSGLAEINLGRIFPSNKLTKNKKFSIFFYV
jgi:hypothetical protein